VTEEGQTTLTLAGSGGFCRPRLRTVDGGAVDRL
jgi:hypothetical protein